VFAGTTVNDLKLYMVSQLLYYYENRKGPDDPFKGISNFFVLDFMMGLFNIITTVFF